MKLFIVAILVSCTFSISAFANLHIRSYRHVPCDSWSFNGACTFRDISRVGAEASSVQRAIYLLADKIERLEEQLETLQQENLKMKKLLSE